MSLSVPTSASSRVIKRCPKPAGIIQEVFMFRSRFAKLTAAGVAATAAVILLVTSAGAHHAQLQARGSLHLTSTASSVRETDKEAAAEAAALAAELQKKTAEQAAEAAAAAAAAQDTETPDEIGDVQSGDQTEETGDNQTEHSD